MLKTIDFSKSIYELCKKDDQIIPIMKELGFDSVTEPGMINSVGRFMTIPKGAVMKNIDLNKIIETFIEKGYIIDNK
jgi:hypothetical protein